MADEASNLAEGLAAVDLPGEDEVQRGQSLLARISTEVVQTFKEYYGKGPTSAKSYMFDDLLFVVMRGGLNASEKFPSSAKRSPSLSVRHFAVDSAEPS